MSNGKITARNTSIGLDSASGTCVAISALMNSATLSVNAEATDVTGFGEQDVQRLTSGLRDWSLSLSGFFSASAASQVGVLLNDIGAGGATRMVYGPSGSVASEIQYSACAILESYSIEAAGPNDSANVSINLQARTGSLTTACWA